MLRKNGQSNLLLKQQQQQTIEWIEFQNFQF